jgi:hypothetical protein
MAHAFDTLGYSKHLHAAGVERTQAEAHAEAARDFIMRDLVTKTDLQIALQAQTIRIAGIVVASAGALATVIGLLNIFLLKH